MMKTISHGQTRALVGSFLIDTPWDDIEVPDDDDFVQSFIQLRPEERGRKFADFIRDRFQIVSTAVKHAVKHLINLDTIPFTPNGWSVEEHQEGGMLEWNSNKVSLHLSPNQEGNIYIKGNELRTELKGKPVLNANVLDYLLIHQDLIPEEWKDQSIFFWGTIYCGLDGTLFVRYLYWHGGWWHWDFLWLGSDWFCHRPALVLASGQ
ncbi:MAG: hypothetical protein A2569_00820 [Candidatus Vogelbacteria bacterium RIFOXYD1_FULL_51_18]|uniref:Uncharacterized protein n=1 Tax=Candidatus Vogelbacteria bacterium RIFOXYD1_FULL_51_18 TaxID=1802440 RepID=A0A1G2QKS6_9BACT|nr:MAG: hypothetical protein A2569_00820 [Candidatus Vogelbacteria bacterium RIFOXYD1_FULL_51_18]